MMRAVTIALVFASWIALSNHCLFAAVMAKPRAAENECPFHSKPAKPQPAPADVQCCKILRAITTAPGKTLARAIVDRPHIDLLFAPLIVSAPTKIWFVVSAVDTGPPGTTSFLELTGSMREHAPPLLA